MKIEEAYAAASAGHRITHEYFSSDEYLENRFGALVAEDGVPFNEEFVRRVKSNDWNADGWRLRQTNSKRNFGPELINVLKALVHVPSDGTQMFVKLTDHRPDLEVSYHQGNPPPKFGTESFHTLFTRLGLTEKEATTTEEQITKLWLNRQGYECYQNNPATFYRASDSSYITFYCKWQPLRTLEQLIKYYE